MEIAIADFAGVSTSSVCRILKCVSFAIARLRPRFVKMPRTDAEMIQASQEFYAIAKFPRVIGTIDCTHVKIQSPGGNQAENYRNRKGWFSFNTQTIAGADLKIQNIVARWPGASHDQTVFNNSKIKMQFERGDFKNFILLVDSGYRNTSYLATPLLNCNTDIESLYNESQIRTRNVVERSYGVWKRRFPVLSMGMRVKLSTVESIIVACAVLHNVAIDSNEPEPPTVIAEFEEALSATDVANEINEEIATYDNIRSFLLMNYFPALALNTQN